MNTSEIPQNWNFYSTNIDDEWASIRLNLALYDVAPIKTHQNIVWFSIKLQNPNEGNLPSQEEFQILNQIEDQMYDEITKLGGIWAAVVTSKTFDFYFYIQDNVEKIKNVCSQVMGEYPTYEYLFKHREDAQWEEYLEFLYPNRYAYQSIMNRGVIHNLLENGDVADVVRPVDHWLYFPTEDAQMQFIVEAEKQGYKLESKNRIDSPENPFQVHIIKESTTYLENINNDVWDLMDLADNFGGVYDGWGCNIMKG